MERCLWAMLFWRCLSFTAIVAAIECGSLDAGLQCSACEHFINGFYAASTKLVFRATKKASVAKVYKERLVAIYEQHSPDKLASVDSLLARAKGKEHDLYVRVCTKYGIAEEAEYKGSESLQELEEKKKLIERALDTTIEDVKTQSWAESDNEGRKIFVDFQKAMSGGSISGSISMGPEVSEKLAACYSDFATSHKDALVSRMAAVKRPYDTKLHKTFCENIAACKSDPDDFFEL